MADSLYPQRAPELLSALRPRPGASNKLSSSLQATGEPCVQGPAVGLGFIPISISARVGVRGQVRGKGDKAGTVDNYRKEREARQGSIINHESHTMPFKVPQLGSLQSSGVWFFQAGDFQTRSLSPPNIRDC